jgi:hypothetical protein
MGMASTAGLNALAHSVTFGINLAVFTNLIQYMYVDIKRRGHRKWGPLYCVIGATVFVMADLVRHLINDANNWYLVSNSGDKIRFELGDCDYVVPKITGNDMCSQIGIGPVAVTEENALGIEMSMYNDDGSLSVNGWIFTIFGTWMGFALLFVGVLWYSDIVNKMRAQFRRLRNPEVTEAFLTPESRAVDLAEVENQGFLTPSSEPRSPQA